MKVNKESPKSEVISSNNIISEEHHKKEQCDDKIGPGYETECSSADELRVPLKMFAEDSILALTTGDKPEAPIDTDEGFTTSDELPLASLKVNKESPKSEVTSSNNKTPDHHGKIQCKEKKRPDYETELSPSDELPLKMIAEDNILALTTANKPEAPLDTDEGFTTSDELPLASLKVNKESPKSEVTSSNNKTSKDHHGTIQCEEKKRSEYETDFSSADELPLKMFAKDSFLALTTANKPEAPLDTDKGFTTSDELPLASLKVNKESPKSEVTSSNNKTPEDHHGTLQCEEKKSPDYETGFSSADELPLKMFAKDSSLASTATGMPEAPLDTDKGFTTSNEPIPVSLKNKQVSPIKESQVEHEKCQSSVTETKKPILKRKIKQEKNETASRSIENLESGKKRIKISKYKATKENIIEESQNLSDQESEVESDDFESDVDLSILTAGNEGMDLSSGNDEDSSDEESKSTDLKWTDKLKKIGPKPFKGPEPGALKQLSHQSSPLNHFYEVFPEKIFPLMTKSTNAYVPIFEEARRKENKKRKLDRPRCM